MGSRNILFVDWFVWFAFKMKDIRTHVLSDANRLRRKARVKQMQKRRKISRHFMGRGKVMGSKTQEETSL